MYCVRFKISEAVGFAKVEGEDNEDKIEKKQKVE